MIKLKQINSFNFFTIQSHPNDVREWHLTALVDIFIHSNGIKTYDFAMPSITCKDKSTQEELWSADNPNWIKNTLLPHLRTKKDCLACELNDEEFDKLNLQKEEIEDIIEVLEKGILIGMLDYELVL
jgi:hypothetical protein